MKAIFAALAACALSSSALAANWSPVQTLWYQGGSFGAPIATNVTLLGGGTIDGIGIRAPLWCGIEGFRAGVFPIQPAVVSPTTRTSLTSENGYTKAIYSVNGGQGALLSAIQVTIDGAPFASCQVEVFVSTGGGLPGGGNTVSGYDFNGFRTCQGLAPNNACTLQANPVTDACIDQGGQSSFCGDCSVLCEVPVN